MLKDEYDLILRTVAVAAAALARLRQRLSGGAPPEEIVRESRAAQGELLGKDAPLLRMLDPQSASHSIGDPERLDAWANLLRLESEALAKTGDSVAAEQAVKRADALAVAAKRVRDRRGNSISK